MQFQRCILNYPYHGLIKTSEKLLDFPLLFSSFPLETTQMFEEKNKAQVEGYIQAFHTFIEYFSQEKFNLLEDIAEYNMVQKLRSSWEVYKSQGYLMKLIGSPDSTKCFNITRDIFIGALLPFRNLNLPKEYYNVQQEDYSTQQLNNYAKIQFKDQGFKNLSFSDFKNINLEEINKEKAQTEYLEKLLKIISLLNKFKIIIENVDIGFVTNYKILILDKLGNVIAGTDDESTEFHSFRLEYVLSQIPFFSGFTKAGIEATSFISTELKSVVGQYTIIDIDGLMDKNLIIS